MVVVLVLFFSKVVVQLLVLQVAFETINCLVVNAAHMAVYAVGTQTGDVDPVGVAAAAAQAVGTHTRDVVPAGVAVGFLDAKVD